MTGKQGMSEREYARHAGLSRPAVAKARLMGRLVFNPDGSINAAASDQRRAAMTDPARTGAAPAGQRAVPAAAVAAVAETLEEAGMTPPASAAGGGATFASAKTAHEIIKAQRSRLALQKQRGELVDRARATGHVFRLARQERDAWLNWPARVASQIAAELGADPHATQQALERNVRAHLAELADIRPELR